MKLSQIVYAVYTAFIIAAISLIYFEVKHDDRTSPWRVPFPTKTNSAVADKPRDALVQMQWRS